jgi:DNA mismatch repair protein MutH
MASLTMALLQERLDPHIGKAIASPRTANKGATGLLLETILGVPHSPRCLDCDDGELKVFPIKRTRTGAAVPKETIAVTMMDRTALTAEVFAVSRVFRKLSRTLYVPYERVGDDVTFYTPTLLDLAVATEVRERLAEDYATIRGHFTATGELKSSLGNLLQCRTKGPGHGSTSRAFYLRPRFMSLYVTLPTSSI